MANVGKEINDNWDVIGAGIAIAMVDHSVRCGCAFAVGAIARIKAKLIEAIEAEEVAMAEVVDAAGPMPEEARGALARFQRELAAKQEPLGPDFQVDWAKLY